MKGLLGSIWGFLGSFEFGLFALWVAGSNFEDSSGGWTAFWLVISLLIFMRLIERYHGDDYV